MKRWVGVALTVQALLIAAFAAVLYFTPIRLEWVGSTSTAPPATRARPEEKATRDVEPMTDQDWRDFEIRWAHAPEDVRALARQIVEGAAPDAVTLGKIGAEALSRGYPAPELDRTWDGVPVAWRSTLLKEAVRAYNLEATLALLAAGADPDADNGEVLFIAIEQKTRGAPSFMLFPDHDEMIPFLRAYLEAGADPNVQRYGFRDETPLYLANGYNNLAAIILLLEFDANPWVQHTRPSGRLGDSVINFIASASGNHAASEVLFRMVHSGRLPKGPEDERHKIVQEIADVSEKFASGVGPDARHTAWRLDQLLQVLGAALDREDETNAIREKLTAFDYQADGGWYLAEDEVHSHYDAPLSTPDKGAEIWGP